MMTSVRGVQTTIHPQLHVPSPTHKHSRHSANDQHPLLEVSTRQGGSGEETEGRMNRKEAKAEGGNGDEAGLDCLHTELAALRRALLTTNSEIHACSQSLLTQTAQRLTQQATLTADCDWLHCEETAHQEMSAHVSELRREVAAAEAAVEYAKDRIRKLETEATALEPTQLQSTLSELEERLQRGAAQKASLDSRLCQLKASIAHLKVTLQAAKDRLHSSQIAKRQHDSGLTGSLHRLQGEESLLYGQLSTHRTALDEIMRQFEAVSADVRRSKECIKGSEERRREMTGKRPRIGLVLAWSGLFLLGVCIRAMVSGLCPVSLAVL